MTHSDLRERIAKALYDDRPTADHPFWACPWERLESGCYTRRQWEAKADVVIAVLTPAEVERAA